MEHQPNDPRVNALPPDFEVSRAEIHAGITAMAQEYLALGVVLGAASLGVELTTTEVLEQLRAGTPECPGDERVQRLIAARRARP